MNNISNQAQIEVAMQMVIMAAIEKGHTDKAQLIEYMQSETFEKAVLNYVAMINE